MSELERLKRNPTEARFLDLCNDVADLKQQIETLKLEVKVLKTAGVLEAWKIRSAIHG
jgi:hypothetical protein